MEDVLIINIRAAQLTFGELLKQLRLQSYMTQRDLALATGYSVGQICRFEQDQRVPDLPTLTARFVPALAEHADAAAIEQLLALAVAARAARRGERRHSPRAPLPALGHGAEYALGLPLANLPVPATPLLGRTHEVARVCALLRHAPVRLLTLTGAPGIGKTRVGLQVAADLRPDFADGVAFVALAPVSDASGVATAIAQALGVTESTGQSCVAALTATLRAKQLLLLLDNFEHVMAAAPLVATLLAGAPGLVVLVTSRTPLRLGGEHEVVVLPLALPELDPLPAMEQLVQSAAVQLFIARAQAVKAPFPLTAATVASIAQICARLDGLPLAIELAATRIKLFPPQALLTRLESRLQLLTAGARDLPVRQQTLRNTIDWSYQLLDAGQQRLVARLSVFVGGCTLEAAEAVCNATGDLGANVLNELAALIDHSLVRQDEGLDGEPRFMMLETIREYTQERLVQCGDAEALQRQHATYYLALVEGVAPALIGAQQWAWLDRLEVEHDNLRAALQWSIDRGDGAIAGRMCATLARFWYERSHLSEGRKWLEHALALLDTGLPIMGVRAKVLNGVGMLAWDTGRL